MNEIDNLIPKLPEPISIAIESMGFEYLNRFWEEETGQPETFLRMIIRKKLEDTGQIPPPDTEDAEDRE